MKFIFLGIVLIGLVYAQSNSYNDANSIQEQVNWLNNNLGVLVSGTGFIYDQSSNILTLSSGTSATLTKDFSGTIAINGGTVELPNSAKFKGEGSYTQSSGFTIKNGNLNEVQIANANGVVYNGNRIEGTTSSTCVPSCTVNNQNIGANTRFFYNLGQNILTAIGKLGVTTFPNANIYFEDGNYKLGDMIVNLKDSEIYLAKGGRLDFDGIKLTAERRSVKLSFIESAEGHKLIPVKNFIVSSTDKSVSDVFKEAGYQGSENFAKRKDIYESDYPNEKYIGTEPQNIKLLNALKSGEAVLFYNDGASNAQASNVRIISRLTDSTPISTPNGPTAKEIFQRVNNPDYAPLKDIARFTGESDVKAVMANINDNMLQYISEQSTKNNLPPITPLIVGAVESRFKEGTGCYGIGEQSCGIMQIKPSTAESLGFKAQDTLDSYKSIEIATKYLGQFNQRYIDIPMPERILHIMAAYKQGAKGYELNGISSSTESYLLKGDRFQKSLERQINTRLSKLKK